MKNYSVTVVADTTVYATIEIEANSFEEALDFALRRDKRPLPAWETSDDEPYDQRVTEIRDEDGVTVYEDNGSDHCQACHGRGCAVCWDGAKLPEFCVACQGKGWEVFNVGEPGFPLGEIACCDDCQAKDGEVDDEPAMEKAIKAGYVLEDLEGHFIVVRRPGDTANLVTSCAHCEKHFFIKSMTSIHHPHVTYKTYYCDHCFGGVKIGTPF